MFKKTKRVREIRACYKTGAGANYSAKHITLAELKNDSIKLQKKIFLYETLNAEKEVKLKQVTGPFKSAKELIHSLKN